MYKLMKEVAVKVKGYYSNHYIQVISGVIFTCYTFGAWTYTEHIPTWHVPYQWFKTKLGRTNVRCPEGKTNSTQTNVEHGDKEGNIQNNKTYNLDGSNLDLSNTNPPDNEFRIILLGATGSGKSSAGNVLIENDNGFKTSCYAKSETKKSIQLSILKKLEIEKASKTFKIDIIDTPAPEDSGLTYQEVENQIQQTIALSSPGPHAFLLCIPATTISNYYTDAIKPFEKYFGDAMYDFVIVVFTRYDQFESDCHNEKAKKLLFDSKFYHAIGKNEILKKHLTNKHTFLCHKTTNKKTNQLKNVIDLINETKQRMEESNKEPFASCPLSKHAECKLQENIKKMKEKASGKTTLRDTVKTSPEHLAHFSQKFCKHCQTFKEAKQHIPISKISK